MSNKPWDVDIKISRFTFFFFLYVGWVLECVVRNVDPHSEAFQEPRKATARITRERTRTDFFFTDSIENTHETLGNKQKVHLHYCFWDWHFFPLTQCWLKADLWWITNFCELRSCILCVWVCVCVLLCSSLLFLLQTCILVFSLQEMLRPRE